MIEEEDGTVRALTEDDVPSLLVNVATSVVMANGVKESLAGELPEGNRPGQRDAGQRRIPLRNLAAFPEAQRVAPKTSVQGGGGLRKRWRGSGGEIYEWDYQHGTVEKYNRSGKHLGEFDPITGAQTKPADKTLSIEP